MGRTARVAVVGAGYWGKNLVRNFATLGGLAMVCDTNKEALERTALAYPGVKIEADYLAVLADPEIDAIALATPAASHYAMALAAMQAGKDVMVEKPLALKAAQGRELVELAERTGRILMVGHLLRFHPAVRVLGRMITEGDLGQLRYIYSNRLNFGKIRDQENILWSFAPHDISLILSFVGDKPSRVRCEGGSYLNAHVADVTLTHLLFRSGVRAHIHVSWLHPFKDQRLVVIGEKGMLVFDDREGWDKKLSYYPHEVEWIDNHPVAQKAEPVHVEVEPGEPLRNECEHFMQCVVDRTTPLTDGREGLAVLEVLEAAQISLDEDRSVDPTTLSKKATRPSKAVDVFVHPTAQVDGPVDIGAGTRIWHFSKLLGPLKIGRGCNLGQNVVVERNVQMGDNVKIQNNVSVYSGVILEDDVFCGPSMVFTNVDTPRSGYPRKGQYQVTRVGKGASIGANATVVCGNTLGTYCFVGAGSVVTRDVPAYGLVYGNPARLKGWSCFCGARLPLGIDASTSEQAACGECEREYVRDGLSVSPIEKE